MARVAVLTPKIWELVLPLGEYGEIDRNPRREGAFHHPSRSGPRQPLKDA